MNPPAHMPWDRRPDEPPDDYGHFLVYRDLGPQRSLMQVRAAAGLSLSSLKALSVRWGWPLRALAWDRVQSQQLHSRELVDLHQRRRDMLRRAQEWQRLALAECASWVEWDQQGTPSLSRELSPAEAVRLLQVGLQAERELLGDLGTGLSPEEFDQRDGAMASRLEAAVQQVVSVLLAAGAARAPRQTHFTDDDGTLGIALVLPDGLRAQITDATRRVLAAWLYWCRVSVGDDALAEVTLWPWDLPFESA